MLETSFQIDIWCHKMSLAKDDIHNYQLNYVRPPGKLIMLVV